MRIVAIFADRWHWSEKEVLELPRWRFLAYLDIIQEWNEAENEAAKGR